MFVTAVFDPHTDNTSDDIFKDKAVEEILIDYNNHFNFKFTVGAYRRFKDDVCSRLAHKEPYKDIDTRREEAVNIVIVVNQLLTGFDSKWINTLYLDKVIDYEQYIQAVSRTIALTDMKSSTELSSIAESRTQWRKTQRKLCDSMRKLVIKMYMFRL